MNPSFRQKSIGAGIGMLCASVGVLGVLPAAAAGVHSRVVPHTGKSAVVVKVAKSRGGFKNVLTTTKGVGATLYTAGSCTASCQSIWPPLFMPTGATVPKGIAGLGTVKVGKHLQITYKKHRLYTFTGDSGSTVKGNGVAGFTVIKNV